VDTVIEEIVAWLEGPEEGGRLEGLVVGGARLPRYSFTINSLIGIEMFAFVPFRIWHNGQAESNRYCRVI
jgi:hypothetical protein